MAGNYPNAVNCRKTTPFPQNDAICIEAKFDLGFAATAAGVAWAGSRRNLFDLASCYDAGMVRLMQAKYRYIDAVGVI